MGQCRLEALKLVVALHSPRPSPAAGPPDRSPPGHAQSLNNTDGSTSRTGGVMGPSRENVEHAHRVLPSTGRGPRARHQSRLPVVPGEPFQTCLQGFSFTSFRVSMQDYSCMATGSSPVERLADLLRHLEGLRAELRQAQREICALTVNVPQTVRKGDAVYNGKPAISWVALADELDLSRTTVQEKYGTPKSDDD